MKKKKVKTDAISTLLGKGASIEGTITFEDAIRIDGNVNGEIASSNGTVIMGEPAAINAKVSVGAAVIRGKFKGTITAKDRIEIYPPADITGDIKAPMVSIEAGVLFNGNCTMGEEFSRLAKDENPKDETESEKNS